MAPPASPPPPAEKWDARYRERGAPGDPSPWVTSLDGVLPHRGRALDVAGGAGRHAIWLARRGLDVTLCDVSTVGLEIAARAEPRLTCRRVDLESEPLPAGPWDLIVCFHYLQRALFPAWR